MDDIRIPNHDDHDDGDALAVSERPIGPLESAGEMVRVKFAKFVQLVATHDFETVLKEYGNDDIVVGANLLTDLANAEDGSKERDEKRAPMMLLAGIVIGIIVTYLLVRF